ncbi:hypothetical protein [Enhygromyxa salina]|uniref:Uncharacterized protein n=1 Tax=Enhygromyxa salina TaxID=215803 RepID=A0A2S9YTM2_9BACT|nr:hypothetical protein [Enhygromyxa salina]PRQ08438.1 hypothetical protein ENSA7_17230 [Enhygromyxa salina]
MRSATLTLSLLTSCSLLVLACNDDGVADATSSPFETTGDGDGDLSESGETNSTGDGDGDGDGESGDGDGDGDPGDGDGDGDPGDGDGDGCQPDPEACEPDFVCDVISGECVDPDAPCTLAGDATACGNFNCGPGSVCDDQGGCIPIAPCNAVACEGDQCWGDSCVCDRPIPCTPASEADLNGPFATDIFDLEFADDCTAWMVTLRSGTDYVRRMTVDATLTQWDGVSNLDMGEVKVLKALNPQYPAAPLVGDIRSPAGPPMTDGGDMLGEVAITYTCCPTCGCFVDPPQGVARLIEGAMVPLPIVLPGMPTEGMNGPFGNIAADAGPMGLTWGDDLRLYVGNSEANGNLDTADLDQQTQEFLTMFESRVTAAAPLTSVHLLIALDTGELLRFNTALNEATPVMDFESGITTLSHDSFSGLVYASLSDLSIVAVDPFSAEVTDFGVMPALGRVTVSPDGKLWWAPAKYIVGDMPLSTWDLPTSF